MVVLCISKLFLYDILIILHNFLTRKIIYVINFVLANMDMVFIFISCILHSSRELIWKTKPRKLNAAQPKQPKGLGKILVQTHSVLFDDSSELIFK